MAAYRLAEIAVDLVESHIKAGIATALANVRAERNDPIVTTEPPKEYFQYETANVYRPPAVFTLMPRQDFRNEKMGANHINAINHMIVACILEDRVERLLIKKVYRYQCAFMQLLHEVVLTSSDNALRLFSRVQSCEFSRIENLKDKSGSDIAFRKEVTLILDVEHIENFQ